MNGKTMILDAGVEKYDEENWIWVIAYSDGSEAKGFTRSQDEARAMVVSAWAGK